MTTIVNHECDAAIAALAIVGIDRQLAAEMVTALHPVLPEATAEDLTQIVLSSAMSIFSSEYLKNSSR